MPVENLTVAGRRFRTQADYEAALRDQKKINKIRSETDMDNPKQVYELFGKLQNGAYQFETAVGTDFDDHIYEAVEKLKARGITPENADSFRKGKKSAKQPKSKASKAASRGKAVNRSKSADYEKELQKQITLELKKREKRRKLIVALASLVAAGCFGYFGVYYFYTERTGADYEELAGLKGKNLLSANEESNTLSVHKTGVRMPDVLEEYKTLYQKNKRLIGWLKIDDTIIDYPVMQTADNEYYLDHNFNQEYDKNGSIFMDYQCSVYPRSTNLILYGHHMNSGQMFGQLQKYAKESYYKEHKTIAFDTIYEKGIYEVIYVFRSRVYNEDDFVFKYYQFIDANSKEEFNSYMREMAEMSLYDTGVAANYGDQLLTLSTCDYSQADGRFVVVARKIK